MRDKNNIKIKGEYIIMAFHEIKPIELNENTFKLFAKDWFLMTAEKEGKVNTMTVGWGGFGVLWKKM